MAFVRFVMDGAEMARLTRGAHGLVWNHLERRAKVFQAAARASAPIKTGCLRASILPRPVTSDPTGLSIRIVSDTTPCNPARISYSLFVHEGTKPHVILGKPILAFNWPNGPNGPGMYFFRKVNHPGTRPQPFFAKNLHLLTD